MPETLTESGKENKPDPTTERDRVTEARARYQEAALDKIPTLAECPAFNRASTKGEMKRAVRDYLESLRKKGKHIPTEWLRIV